MKININNYRLIYTDESAADRVSQFFKKYYFINSKNERTGISHILDINLNAINYYGYSSYFIKIKVSITDYVHTRNWPETFKLFEFFKRYNYKKVKPIDKVLRDLAAELAKFEIVKKA